MADDLIELAFEGVDKVSDPNFYYHRRRKEQRDKEMAKKEGYRETAQANPPTRGRGKYSRSPSPADPFDNPRQRYQYPDARNPNFGARGGRDRPDWYQPPPEGGRDQLDGDDRQRKSHRSSRPALRSRSSHQGDSSRQYDEKERSPSRRSSRRSSSQKRSSRKSSPPRENAMTKFFSDSDAGIGALLAGTAAGGLLAYRATKNKEGGEPMIATILGAVVGGVGANAVERYVEHGKEEGKLRDKWGDEVGSSRARMMKKMSEMGGGGGGGERGGERGRERGGGRHGRKSDDDEYDRR